MNDSQRTRQMQAIHIDYARKVKDSVLPQLHPEMGDGCHIWATQVLGRCVSTLKACTDFELNLLRDRLNGRTPKLLNRAVAEFARLGIQNPDRWIARCAESETFRKWRGRTLETLDVSQLYRLVKTLERRSPGRVVGGVR